MMFHHHHDDHDKTGREEATKLASDAMYRLEHSVGDKRKAEDATPRIEQIKVCVDVCICVCTLVLSGLIIYSSVLVTSDLS